MAANPLAQGLGVRRQPDPCALVVFGASGDLTKRKLFPALYSLAYRDLLPQRFAVVGVARTEETTRQFVTAMRKAVKQFSRGVLWPDLDVLVVDLPPGTGDVPLSLAQSIVVDGAVVVTTPQRLATMEAGKAIEMFRRLEVPVLGVVENMSYATCECGRRSYPFGRGGGDALCRATSCALLAQIPFDQATVASGDRGTPLMAGGAEGETAEAFRTAARRVRDALAPPALEAELVEAVR